MTGTESLPVSIRPHVGTRRIGQNMCVINQKRSEAWLCKGSSRRIWEDLRRGDTPEDIAAAIHAKYNVPLEKVRGDVSQFVEHLWRRQILDMPGREHISDKERAALVTERSHDETGRLAAAAIEAEQLVVCILDLLIPCNLRCRHCYLDFSEKDILPLAEVCSYLDQLRDHGCPEVTLTGGEIFLRKDLLDIIAHVDRNGFLMSLLTNGNFIDKKMADRLAQYNFKTVQISLYGTTAEIHERITGKKGTFAKSTAAARFLIERGVPVSFAYFIQQDNFEDAFRFPDFARKMGAKYNFDTKLVPNRNGSQDILRYGVTIQQQAELYKSRLLHHQTEFICTAAVSKARITAHGDIYPCELINTAVVGNLRKQTLAEIWASPTRAAMRKAILGYKPHRCGGCSHTTDCEPCAAMRGFNQQGHMEAPVSEACMLTTASLLSHGVQLEDSSPFRKFTDSCMEAILTPQSGNVPAHSLVQIMSSRVSIQ